MSSAPLDRRIFMRSALLDHIIFDELHSSWPYNISWAPLFLTAYYFMSSALLDPGGGGGGRDHWPGGWGGRGAAGEGRMPGPRLAGERLASGRELKLHRVGRELSFFSSRRNCDSPMHPSPAGECAPPPFGSGMGGTLALAGEGLGKSQFRRGDIHCGTLYTVCRYFVWNCIFSPSKGSILDLR